MNWKKALSLVLILVVGLFVFIPQQSVAAGSFIDPYENLFDVINFGGKSLKNTEYGASDTPLYLRYPIWGYQFSNTLSSDLTGLSLLNGLLSLCMMAMAGAALVVIGLVGWAFNFTGLDGIADTVENFVKVLTDKLFFSEFFIIGLFFLGISLMFAFGRNEDVAGKLIKVIFNLILAFTILFNMGTIIKYLNQLGWYGSSLVLKSYTVVDSSGTKYADDAGVDAFVKLGDKFFEYNVYLPFQLANFGGYAPLSNTERWNNDQKQIDKDTKSHFETQYGDAFVNFLEEGWEKLKNSAREVIGVVESLWNGVMDLVGADGAKTNIATKFSGKAYLTMTPFGIPFRILILFLTFVIGTTYGCLLLALAGASILCQIFMYLLAIFAPLIFLCALIPEWGDRVLLKWFEFLFAAGIYKVISTLVLVAILFLQGAIYTSLYNWLYAMFAQLLLVMAIFLFRKQLSELIPLAGVAVFQNAEDQLYNRSKQAVNKMIETTVDVGKTAVAGGLAVAGVATGTPLLTKGLQMTGGTLGRMAGSLAEDAANRRSGGSGPTTDRDPGPGQTPPGPISNTGGGNNDDPPDDNKDGGGGSKNDGPKDTGPRSGGRSSVPKEEAEQTPDVSSSGGIGGGRTTGGRTGVPNEGDGDVGDGGPQTQSPSAYMNRRQAIDPMQTPVAQDDGGTTFRQGIPPQMQPGQSGGIQPHIQGGQSGGMIASHQQDNLMSRTGVGNFGPTVGSQGGGGTTINNITNITNESKTVHHNITQQSGSSNTTGIPLTGGAGGMTSERVIERQTVVPQQTSGGSSGANIGSGSGGSNSSNIGRGQTFKQETVVRHEHSGQVNVTGGGGSSTGHISGNTLQQGGGGGKPNIHQHITNQNTNQIKQGSSGGTTSNNPVKDWSQQQIDSEFESIANDTLRELKDTAKLLKDTTKESSFKGGVSGNVSVGDANDEDDNSKKTKK